MSRMFAALAASVALALAVPMLAQPPPTQPHSGRGSDDDVKPSAPGGEARTPGARAEPSFEAADKDHDGKLSRSEASGVPALDFARADADRDSSLSRQEFDAFFGARRSR